MIKSLANELLEAGVLDRDDVVVAGVSGGPDSMALLHLLVEFNRKLEWRLRLHVAHLNHNLRGREAEEDAAFVQAAADNLGLPCTIESRDIPALAARQQGTIEEISRRERYAFFERACLKYGAGVLALAHHKDDNAETVLHRILRGTGLRGLAGIQCVRPLSPNSDVRVVRPLLKRSRKWILEFLDGAGVPYREDCTNASTEPMRNRIRHQILPVIEAEVNPQVREALLRLAEQAGWLDEIIRDTARRTLDTLIISHTADELVLNVDALRRKSRIVQAEIVRLAYSAFGLGEQDLGFAHLTAALELISDSASGKQVQLPGGLAAEKRYQHLVFSLPAEQPEQAISEEVTLHLPGRTVLPIRRLEIECSLEEVGTAGVDVLRQAANRFEEFVDLDAIRPPLVARGRRPGDRFFPLGAPGSKKLSHFLIDAKVEPRERDRVAVLCDEDGPIWVIGHRIDDRAKLRPDTKRVLHLRARSLDQ